MPARKRAAKSAKKKDSTAHLGFEAKLWLAAVEAEKSWQWSGATWTTMGSPNGSRGGANQFGVPPMTAPRACVHWDTEGTPQVASEARDNNASFAWVQHFMHHLAPQTALRACALNESGASPQVVSEAKDNMAGFVLANGSMSSNQSGEGEIRKAIIEADLVDTAVRESAVGQSEATPQVLSTAKNNMVALPGQLFYSTQIPVCLWFLAKNQTATDRCPHICESLVTSSRKAEDFRNGLTFKRAENRKLAA